jgi:beta-mannosidase
MNLGGLWRVTGSTEDLRRDMADPALDDSGWATQEVPGHWRSVPDLAASDGPVLYRRWFTADPPAEDGRAFLVFDGIFYQSDVWLDGDYLGDTEGYFFPHTFEITEALRSPGEHLLAIEVACAPPGDRRAKRNLTGVFQHWDCIDAAWNPGGIWGPVRIVATGPVRIDSLKVLCPEAGAERAVLDLEAVLDSPRPGPVRLATRIEPEAGGPSVDDEQDQMLSAGTNVVRWRMAVDRPQLWWPRALGSQPLYRVEVTVGPSGGGPAGDRRSVVTGLRQIRVRNFIATVNGERLYLKGANCGPTRRDPASATPAEVAADVELAAGAGLDLLRVHAHIARPELYEAADRAGMLIWQDLPLQWGYGNVRRQAVQQARRAVDLLGHHPSIALWCGHNEPMAVDPQPGAALAAGTMARRVAAQVLPTWNKTGLDRSIRRALERADGSRTVVAHSGVLPHPLWGTDSHVYYGWYHGSERDFPAAMARLPVMARFVGEFGAQAVPESAGFMRADRWPDLDWDELTNRYCLQKDVFDARVPPADYPEFDQWRRASQDYQATVLRHHIETLRRLKYRPTGGFCLFLLADAQPAVSWAIVDHDRVPKAAYRAVAEACAPVIIVADRPDESYRPGDRLNLDVHAVSDLRHPIVGAVTDVTLAWASGRRRWRFAGDVGADGCVRIGRISTTVPGDARPGPVTLELTMRWAGGEAVNRYDSRVEL